MKEQGREGLELAANHPCYPWSQTVADIDNVEGAD
jgi:hypothetical protein